MHLLKSPGASAQSRPQNQVHFSSPPAQSELLPKGRLCDAASEVDAPRGLHGRNIYIQNRHVVSLSAALPQVPRGPWVVIPPLSRRPCVRQGSEKRQHTRPPAALDAGTHPHHQKGSLKQITGPSLRVCDSGDLRICIQVPRGADTAGRAAHTESTCNFFFFLHNEVGFGFIPGVQH